MRPVRGMPNGLRSRKTIPRPTLTETAMRTRSTIHAAIAVVAALAASIGHAQQLRFGLAEDPDVLDPTLARTFVGRVVFAALCDKLFDIDEKLNIVPQLATGYEWSADRKALTIKLRKGVTFHDGEKLDAAAAKFNIERHKTMAGSNRRGELAPVATVDVVDESTVRLNLSAPFSPLLAALADRAGMMVSPKAAQAEGDKFGAKPVCSGPFRFVERVAQDRIVLERYSNYWNKGEIHLDKITYLPIVDSTVRLANLRSGQLDIIERMAASDIPSLKTDSRFKVAKITEIGYYGITINVGKSELSQKNPLGKDPRVREAFELALDRDGIVQVAMDGEAAVGNPRDSDDVRCAKNRAGRAGDGEGGRIRREDPVDRVCHVAGHGGQGTVRGVRSRVERPRRSRRQSLQLRFLQGAAGLRGLLQARRRRPPQPLAQRTRCRGAQEALRADRCDRAQGSSHRLPVPSSLALGAYGQTFRLAHDSGWIGARAGVEAELNMNDSRSLWVRIHSHGLCR